MQTAIFSTRPYDKSMLSDANREAGHDLRFLTRSRLFSGGEACPLPER